MSILVDKPSRVIVQGITGGEGSFHAEKMLEYGTNVVGGVTPGKGGTTHLNLPVFNSVKEAVDEAEPDVSIIFVPAGFAMDAVLESIDARVPLIITITEGIPVIDMLKIKNSIPDGIRIIGPNCPGVISPGKAKIGIMPGHIHKEGRVGVISRSGTLTYEIVNVLSGNNIGQSTCIGIGGDPIIGSRFVDLLKLFEEDTDTDAVVIIGEIGGNDEEIAAEYFKTSMTKPVAAFIAGQTAPPGKRMGHAGAIISGGKGTAKHKIQALEAAGIPVAKEPVEIGKIVKGLLR